jgi:hypothetical protein
MSNIRPYNSFTESSYSDKYITPSKKTESKLIAEDKDYSATTHMRLDSKTADGKYTLRCLGRELDFHYKFNSERFIDGVFPKNSLVNIIDGNFPIAPTYTLSEQNSGVNKKVRVDYYPNANACKHLAPSQCQFGISLAQSQGGRRRRRGTKRRRVKHSTRRR